MKELAIRDYLSKVNWKANWNYKIIEEDMRRFLGERPSLEAEYKKDVMLNEITGEAKEFSSIGHLRNWLCGIKLEILEIFLGLQKRC